MGSDEPSLRHSRPVAESLRMVSGLQSAADAGETGGDPACWACLVCEECGVVVSEGHRDSCSHFRVAADPQLATVPLPAEHGGQDTGHLLGCRVVGGRGAPGDEPVRPDKDRAVCADSVGRL